MPNQKMPETKRCHTVFNFYEGSNPGLGETLAPQMMTTQHPPGSTVGFPPFDHHFHLPSDSFLYPLQLSKT